MNRIKERTRIAVVLALVWAIGVLMLQQSGVLVEWDSAFLDWQQRQPPVREIVSNDLALIAIDRIPSDRPWPWPRLDFALVLRALIPTVPQSVVFEVLLHDQNHRQEAFDGTFASLVERHDRVIFAAAAFQVGNEVPPPGNLISIPFEGEMQSMTPYHSVFWPVSTFSGGCHVGVSNMTSGPQGSVKSIPLVFRWRERVIPSLVLQAAAERLGADLSKSKMKIGTELELRDAKGKLLRRIPVDREGGLRVRYRKLSYPVISFDDFLVYADQRERNEVPAYDLRTLRRRQVWVGRTDQGAVFQSPLGPRNEVEVQMQAVENILQNDFFRPAHPALIGVLFISFAVCVAGLMVVWKRLWAAILVGVVAGVYGEGAVLMLQGNNILFPVPAFGLLCIGAVLAGLAAVYWEFSEAEVKPEWAE